MIVHQATQMMMNCTATTTPAGRGRGHDSRERHHNLFTLGPDLDAIKAALCFLVLIGVTVILESGLAWVEHALRERKHYQAMLDKVQRELMLLGLLSFVLFLTETSGDPVKLEKSWMVPFEFAHVLIFFVAIAYTLQAFWLAVIINITWREVKPTGGE